MTPVINSSTHLRASASARSSRLRSSAKPEASQVAPQLSTLITLKMLIALGVRRNGAQRTTVPFQKSSTMDLKFVALLDDATLKGMRCRRRLRDTEAVSSPLVKRRHFVKAARQGEMYHVGWRSHRRVRLAIADVKSCAQHVRAATRSARRLEQLASSIRAARDCFVAADMRTCYAKII